MRLNKNTVPEIGEMVLATTMYKRNDIFYVNMVGYNKQGLIPISAMSKSGKKNKKVFKIGLKYPALVTCTDNNVILLSRIGLVWKNLDKNMMTLKIKEKVLMFGVSIYNFYLAIKKCTESESVFEKIMGETVALV